MSRRNKVGGITASAGYPQYSGNLIPEMMGMELIERFYETSIFGEISTTDYLGELSGKGDQITFWREPCVIIRDYTKDQTLKHDTLEVEPVKLVIDRAKYFAFKMDKIDESMMSVWPKMKAAMLKNASIEMANNIDCELLGSLYVDADCRNKGPNAGCISGSYNLGQTGAPVVLTSANVVQFLTMMHGVLNQRSVPREGRYLVIPTEMETLILNSELRQAYLTGMNESPLLNGRIPTTISGFQLYVSNHVCRVRDVGTNTDAYHIIGGIPGATCFASVMQHSRTIEDKDTFDTYYDGLQVYGFDVIRPEALVAAYVRLS